MNPPIVVDIPHQLGVAEAHRRIEQGFSQLAEKIAGPGIGQVSRRWQGDQMVFSLGALGQFITGQLLITGDLVRIEVQLPGFLSALGAVIGNRLQMQGQALLEKKR